MKLRLLLGIAGIPLLMSSCAEPLQRIAAEHREQRMTATYSNHPVTYGAADGPGGYSAQVVHSDVAITQVPAHH